MKTITQKLFKIALICSIFLSLFSAQAQAPQKMSYQAVVRNAANALIANTAVGVKISVLQTTASGTVVYSERHTPTTNANGLATFEIGGGTVLTGTFAGINWANGPYFIKTETDPTGGTSYTISGTSQLASVPYALFAANAGSGTSGWGLNGTAGTTASNFIGTTDNTSLTLKTNNAQAMKIGTDGVVNIGSGASGPITTRLGVAGNSSFSGSALNNLDSFGTAAIKSPDPLGQDNDPILAIDGETIQTKGFDQQGSYANNLKLNPFGGNIGIGNTGTLQNKLQIGNPPGFSGNDIAIGNGTQAMSLFQSPTASTFFTNTNFAFMPASGPANVGIGTTTPTEKLHVEGNSKLDGNLAMKYIIVNSSYTVTGNDNIIYVDMGNTTSFRAIISLPTPSSCPGKTYTIKALNMPQFATTLRDREIDGNSGIAPSTETGFVEVADDNGVLTTLGKAYIFNSFGYNQTFSSTVTVQSIGSSWQKISSNWFIDSSND